MYANMKAKNFNTQGIYGVNVEAIIIRVANIMLLILVIIIIYIGNLQAYHESYTRI